MKSLNIKLIITIIVLVDKTIKIQKHNFFNLINLFFVLIKRNINIYFLIVFKVIIIKLSR